MTDQPMQIGGGSSLITMIGGMRQTQEMLDFCADHHLGAEIEVIPAGKISDAYERVLVSDVRYRFVIDTSTLGWNPRTATLAGSVRD